MHNSQTHTLLQYRRGWTSELSNFKYISSDERLMNYEYGLGVLLLLLLFHSCGWFLSKNQFFLTIDMVRISIHDIYTYKFMKVTQCTPLGISGGSHRYYMADNRAITINQRVLVKTQSTTRFYLWYQNQMFAQAVRCNNWIRNVVINYRNTKHMQAN